MPGDGTKLGTTTHNPPPARLLDLTRLIRRAGKVLTGVDQVEAAYLRALLHDDVPLFGLIRSRLGYILLDRAGLDALCPVLMGNPADVRQGQILRLARSHAIARVPPILLTRMLRRALPRRVAYVNVGHSNLTQRVLGALRAVDAHIAVMIHDVIPLEFPDYQRDGTVPAFAAMIARVGAAADLVIYNSNDTKRKAEAQWRAPPASIVSHLGTKTTSPAPDEIPKGTLMRPPFFICIGTIEPRKNHAFLLDVWAEMGPDAPGLIIAGGRGWKNEAVFARLDALPPDGPVREVAGLSDGALAALMGSVRRCPVCHPRRRVRNACRRGCGAGCSCDCERSSRFAGNSGRYSHLRKRFRSLSLDRGNKRVVRWLAERTEADAFYSCDVGCTFQDCVKVDLIGARRSRQAAGRGRN